MFSKIAQTGFYVSIISYISFWLFDAIKPGFVARVFSVHIFLLSAIGFGIWWALIVKEYNERAWLEILAAIVLGIILSTITWLVGDGFGMFRFLVVIIAFFTPLLLMRLIKVL